MNAERELEILNAVSEALNSSPDVRQALERTLANGDLVQETISGQGLLFLPSLKRAEENIATRIKNLCASRLRIQRLILKRLWPGASRRQAKSLRPVSGRH